MEYALNMETPPLRTFLFLITFLAVFGLLIATIPSGFLVVTDEYEAHDIPEDFRVKDLESYASTLIITMNETGGKEIMGYYYRMTFEIGGHKCFFDYTMANKSNLQVVFIHRFTGWFWIETGHNMNWKNRAGLERGNVLTVEELESDYADYLPYDVICSHFYLDGSFNYDEENYTSVEDAWNHHGLSFFIGIEFDQLKTGLNAWDLIGMILFFELPNVHPVLNYIIKIPIWVAITWLAFAFVIAIIKSLPLT